MSGASMKINLADEPGLQAKLAQVLEEENPLVVAELLRVMQKISQALGGMQVNTDPGDPSQSRWITKKAFLERYQGISPTMMGELITDGTLRTKPLKNGGNTRLIDIEAFEAWLDKHAQGGPLEYRNR